MEPFRQTFRIPPACAALLLFAVFLAACGESEGQDTPQGSWEGQGQGEAPVPAVEAVQARYGALPLRERLTGTVRATGQVAIYPETSGPVVAVLAQNGDYVRRGEPLVRIRAQISQAQLAQAQANLEVARAQARQAEANVAELEAQFTRTKALAEDSLVSMQTLETQRAQVEAARANHAQAQAQVELAQAAAEESKETLGQTVVRAPIDGYVGGRNVEVGMMAGGQTHLFTIGRLDRVRVEVPVTQEMLGRIREGQTVEISAASLPDTVITAKVSRISPFLQQGSYSTEAEIDVPNEGGVLRPGMFVTVDVFYGESQQATLVPKSAVYEHPTTGEQGVYVATSLGSETQPAEPGKDGRAPLTPETPTSFRPVEVLAEGSQMVGLRGVEPGAWVVVVGQHLLSGRTESGRVSARVRPVSWERIIDLQRLQRQDLLRQFMEKQQRLAHERMDSTNTADSAGTPLSRTSM